MINRGSNIVYLEEMQCLHVMHCEIDQHIFTELASKKSGNILTAYLEWSRASFTVMKANFLVMPQLTIQTV